MKIKVLLLCSLLAGCVDVQAQQRLQQQQAQMNYCNNLSPWVVMAECQDRVVSNDTTGTYQDPGSQELIGDRRVLIEAVREKKMTNLQAQAVFQERISGMNKRVTLTNAMYGM